MIMVESQVSMTLKEENNSWRCQHFQMDSEMRGSISIQSKIQKQNGTQFLNFNSKQAKIFYSIRQKVKNSNTMLR